MQNALIEENYFDVDDDALCVKSGRDWDGRQFGRPARDILFRNNVRDSDGINRGETACESGKHRLLQVIGRGHGITIGSETSGSVYNGNSRPSLRPAVRGRAMPGATSLLDLPPAQSTPSALSTPARDRTGASKKLLRACPSSHVRQYHDGEHRHGHPDEDRTGAGRRGVRHSLPQHVRAPRIFCRQKIAQAWLRVVLRN